MTNVIKVNTYGDNEVKLELVFNGYREVYRASVNECQGDYYLNRKGYTSVDLKKANERFNAYCREFKTI